MGWRGAAIGGYLGSLFGGPLGVLLGAAIGHGVEKKLKSGAAESAPRRPRMRTSSSARGLVFCASAAAMLAKMAKADGRVTSVEIAAVEKAFARLGFSDSAREYAVSVFRRAKDDAHTIYDYAAEFARAVSSVEVRELFYELLWDLACADGVVTAHELHILKTIPGPLGIRAEWFGLYSSERLGSRQRRRTAEPPRDPLAEAYARLGVPAGATDDEVRRAYREFAKKNHPDVLKAQGLPDELVGKATERMAKVNAAWSAIREARKL